MRVLLSGYYGFENVGDEAILSGLARALRERGFEPSVLSADPSATQRRHGVRAYHRIRGLVPALLANQALVSGGGGLLQDATSARSLRYYLAVIGAARALGRRVVVYGQSLGPLSPAGAARVGRALRGMPLALRDAASVDLAASLGLSATKVADAALLLAPPAAARRPGGGADAPVLVVPRGGKDELNAALADAATRLRAAGVPVRVLALHAAEDDEAAARLCACTGATPISADDPAEALRLLAEARFVLSVRLHGLVLAYLAGVGAAGLAYDPKVTGFAREAGLQVFEAPVDGEQLAEVALVTAVPDAEHRASLLQRALDGADWLADALGRTP